MNNLWGYLQGLSLTQANRKWLAEKLVEPRKPRLYDPETGEYLNDETMKAIEEGRKGVGMSGPMSFEEYLERVKNI